MSDDATVLIVDDEHDIVELYSAFLTDEYEVLTATGGEAALSVVDEAVDIVVLDRRMPGLSGDAVLKEIRDRGLDARVAMLTAVEPEADIVEMPFDDYITKPVTKADLHGVIEVLLHRQTYDERSQQFFRLASKKAALEMAGNVDSEEYRQLCDRLDEVRADVNETLDELSMRAAFDEIGLPGD